jgi:hypothetical protein
MKAFLYSAGLLCNSGDGLSVPPGSVTRCRPWGSVVCVVIRPEVQEDQPELLGQHMTVAQLPRDNQPRNLPRTHSQFIDRPQLPGFAPGGGEKAEPRFDVHKFWV